MCFFGFTFIPFLKLFPYFCKLINIILYTYEIKKNSIKRQRRAEGMV